MSIDNNSSARSRRLRSGSAAVATAAGVVLAATALPAAAAAASEPVARVPRLVTDRGETPPRSLLKVQASGFSAGGALVVSLDGHTLARGVADAQGAYAATVVVPFAVLPGTYPLTVSQGALRAVRTFRVYTNWAQERLTPGGSYDNIHENILSASTAAGLAVSAKGPASVSGSSPVMVNGTVYALDTKTGSTYAQDLNSEQVLWTTGNDRTAPWIVGSPVVADNVVYTNDDAGNTAARDPATGNYLWSVNVGGERFLYDSPIVENGVVYVLGSEYAAALNAADGTIIWKVPANGYGAPALVNGVLYIGGAQIEAINAADGSILWSVPSPNATSGITYANGMLYYAAYSSLQSGSPSEEIALTASNGSQVWETSFESGAEGSPVVGDGNVYQYSNYTHGDLTAFNAATGAVTWSDIGTLGSVLPDTDVVANGVLYASELTQPGGRFLAINDATGAIISSISGLDTYGRPIVANGHVYVGAANAGITTLSPASTSTTSEPAAH